MKVNNIHSLRLIDLKGSLFLSLFFLFSGAMLGGGEWSADKISASIKEGASIVTRLQIESLEVLGKTKSIYKMRHVYTVLDKDKDDGAVSIYYGEFFKLSDISLTIYDASGDKVKTYKKNDFIDHKLFDGSTLQDDIRYLTFPIQRAEYPYTVEINYERLISCNFLIPDFYVQSYDEAIERKEISIKFPKDLQIKMKSYNIDKEDVITEAQTSDNTETFSWVFKDKKAIKFETNSPPSSEVLPLIKCVAEKFVMGKVEGSMDSWESFSSFLFQLNQDRFTPTEEIKTVVAGLIEGAESEFDKIDRIYAYLKANMRYVNVSLGVGGWQSFPAEYVHKNKFGDCKALSYYMKTLLSVAGIESYTAATYRGEKREVRLDENFPENVFNHMILYIPGQDLFLECTSRNYPTGYVGSDNDQRKCLIVKPNGGMLKEVKNRGEISDFSFDDIEIDITDEFPKVKYRMEKSGNHQEDWRYIIDNYSQNEKEKYFLSFLDLPPSKIENLDIKYDKENAIAIANAEFDLLKFGNITGNRFFVNVNAINRLVIENEKEKKERKENFYLNFRGAYKAKVTVHLPSGYQVEHGMLDQKVESPFGAYEVKTTLDENVLTYTRTFNGKEGLFQANQYEDYNNFIKAFNKIENSRLVLVKP